MNNSKPKFTNKLIEESSPYLLQHAHNPVNWQAWNDEALAEAQKNDKLILVSVGYAACHWCHVMEHESFEDEEVAAVMNANFVNIKVDREERPDIDQIYMDACQLMNGNGGWPLNAIALPDGRPIFAGTYFRKEDWLKLLNYFADLYPQRKTELQARAEQIRLGIQSYDAIELNLSEAEFSEKDLNEIWQNWEGKIDFTYGGRMGAPKFPMPNNWQFLMSFAIQTKDKNAFSAVKCTLDNMMMGGIYDHIRGGFARYSVDDVWKVPHFEKMLYDNGQLVALYAQTYAATQNIQYKLVVSETIEWLKSEMLHENGGFYASLDADSEGVEGKFYVWQESELDALLGNNAEILKKYWSVEKHGNWEENNILFTQLSLDEFCAKNKVSSSEFLSVLQKAKSTLLAERNKRIKPGLDDKMLTSWNGLMLKGLVDAYKYTQVEEYYNLAENCANFLLNNVIEIDGRIYRNFKNGKATINGFLDDYSFTIEAFIAFYELSGNELWLLKANELMRYVIEHFFNANSGMFFYTSKIDTALITRKTEISDNVIPSSNSSIAKGLWLLSKYFENAEYAKIAEQMLHNMKENVVNHGAFYSNWGILLHAKVFGIIEVVIIGEQAQKIAKQMQENYLPNTIFAFSQTESDLPLFKNRYVQGKTLIYICKNNTCQRPTESLEEAMQLLKSSVR